MRLDGHGGPQDVLRRRRGLARQLEVRGRGGPLAQQRAHALLRAVAHRREVVAALQGQHNLPNESNGRSVPRRAPLLRNMSSGRLRNSCNLSVGELHEVARHVREAGGRNVVAAERRGMARRRVETARHQHDLRVVLLSDKRRFKTVPRIVGYIS